jgi:FMN reductase
MNSENECLRVVGTGGTLREGSTSLGALRRALSAADEAGAEVELLDLRQLRLPMYEPGRPLDDHDPEVWRFIEAVRRADALVLSTAAYHGRLDGVTKTALDSTRFVEGNERVYLESRALGLISTAGDNRAAANTTDAMVHIVHALRDIVAPQMMLIGGAWKRFADEWNVTEEGFGRRLDRLGRLVVDIAEALTCGLKDRDAEAVGVAL